MLRWSRPSRPGSRGSRCDGSGDGSVVPAQGRDEVSRRQRATYLIVTGAGRGGTVVGWVPGPPDACASGGPAFGPGIGCAEAVVVGAGPPGSTTTRVPTF